MRQRPTNAGRLESAVTDFRKVLPSPMTGVSDNSSDQELIAAVNAGDAEAFERLYFRYRDWVTRLAFRFTRHEDDALDVLQDTFSYVLRKFPGLELTAAMTTFLYPAVRNLSIAARRRRQRSLGASADVSQLTDAAAIADDSSATGSDPGELSDVLATLSESHREILLMRYVDDMTQPEIAAALTLPLGTVKSRLHHAIAAVRNSPIVLSYLTAEQG